MVRRAVVRILRRRYAVTDVPTAESALTLIDGGASYDVILCDLHLSGMSGRDLVLTLEAQRPAQARRVVILSGSPRTTMDDVFLAVIGPRFLEKPASIAEIDAIIGSLVGASAQAA